MNTQAWLIVCMAALGAAALTWGLAFWWYGRQLKASAARLAKLEAARELLRQQSSQARKQLEHLQAEANELRLAVSKLDAARAQELRAHAASRIFEDSGPFIEEPRKPGPPADGFAPTQILPGKR